MFSFGIILAEMCARVSADPDFLPRTKSYGLDIEAFKRICKACPKVFLELMEKCCCLSPEERPSFWEVLDILNAVDMKRFASLDAICELMHSEESGYISGQNSGLQRSHSWTSGLNGDSSCNSDADSPLRSSTPLQSSTPCSSMEYHPLMHKSASEMFSSPRSIDTVGFVVSSYGCSGETPSKFNSLRLDNSHITNVW